MFLEIFCVDVRILATILLLGKVGFVANDTLTPLKLLDHGFPKESLSVAFFIDFILQTVLGWFFGSGWSGSPHHQEHPLRPWQQAALFKTLISAGGMWLVSAFPKDGQISSSYFLLVMIHTIVSSFCSTIMLLSMVRQTSSTVFFHRPSSRIASSPPSVIQPSVVATCPS